MCHNTVCFVYMLQMNINPVQMLTTNKWDIINISELCAPCKLVVGSIKYFSYASNAPRAIHLPHQSIINQPVNSITSDQSFFVAHYLSDTSKKEVKLYAVP